MTEPIRQRPVEQGVQRRLECAAVRFDVVRLPSGMYTHRTRKVVVPVPNSPGNGSDGRN